MLKLRKRILIQNQMGRNENQRKKGGKDEIQRVEISDTDSDEKNPNQRRVTIRTLKIQTFEVHKKKTKPKQKDVSLNQNQL